MKKNIKAFLTSSILMLLFSISGNMTLLAQSAMTNMSGRNCTTLDGKWEVIIDPTGIGEWRQVWKERKPEKKTDFVEYSFEGGPSFNVPGDFNTQMLELTFYEGIVWYKKNFTYDKNPDKRIFLHFGAVNYTSSIYLNGEPIGKHEGGFTPFQFELTSIVKEGENTIIVRVNNQRLKDGIPGVGYDWFNYGGITRDVNLIETSNSYIDDYSVQLAPNSSNEISGWIRIDGEQPIQKVRVSIPELKASVSVMTDGNGTASFTLKTKPLLWSPENPKLYKVILISETDSISEEIGFRSIEVKGAQIILNGKPIFLRAVNIHEEMPLRAAKAFSEEDAQWLLTQAKDMGCNLVRLAHYPHNEYMVKTAEKMGLLVWEEIPVYQHIEFSAPSVEDKMSLMLKEMIKRDRNRCNTIIWCISNETYSFTPNRDNALIKLSQQCKKLDPSRLVTSVINDQGYDNNTFNVWDTLYNYFDIVSINEYIGWYVPWQGKPADAKWQIACANKPVFISEFGGEALYGNANGNPDEAFSWREEYQEQIYKDQVTMFPTIPNLVGVCPWLLVDYRSPGRMHPIFQRGWNRKGLLSDKGEKKKAWFIIKKFYDDKKQEQH
jgi:beta-glucuronidase